MTAHAMKEDMKKCFNAGMDDYISKPVDAGELFAAIGRQMDKKNKEVIDAHRKNQKEVLFDRENTFNRLGEDEELLREIVNIFLEKTPSIIENLKIALKDKDLNLIKRYAHTIKGASGNSGAVEINKTVLIIEKSLEENDFETMTEYIQKLDEQFKRFSDFVKREA
jgi:HPt (histidine-containing phosphotransfer) domain-containing protein